MHFVFYAPEKNTVEEVDQIKAFAINSTATDFIKHIAGLDEADLKTISTICAEKTNVKSYPKITKEMLATTLLRLILGLTNLDVWVVPQSPHRLDDNEENEEEFFSSDDDILMEDEGGSYFVNKNEIVKDAKEMLAEGVAAEKLPGRFKEVFSEYLLKLKKARTTKKKKDQGAAKSDGSEGNEDGEKANENNSTANDGNAKKDCVPAVTNPARKDASTAKDGDATEGGVPAEKDSAVKDNSAAEGIGEDDTGREKEKEVVDISESGTVGANAKSGGDVVSSVESVISKDSRNANEGDHAKKKAEAKKSHDKSDSSDAGRSRKDQCHLFWQGKCPFGTSGRSSSDGSKCEGWHPKKCQKFIKFGFKEGGCTDKKCLDLHPKICFKNMQGKKCNKIDCTFLHPQSYVVQQKQGQHSTQESKGDKKSAEKVDNAQVAKNKKKQQQPPPSSADAKNNKGGKHSAGPKGNQGKSPAVASGPKKDDKEEATEVAPEGVAGVTPAGSPFHEFRLQLMQIKEQIQTMQAMQQWLLTSMRPLQQQHQMPLMQPMQPMQSMGMLANQAMTPFAR